MVVYDIRYGAEGMFLGQEELSGVSYFDLVMPDVPVSTAHTHSEKFSLQGKVLPYLGRVCCDMNHLNVLV